MKDEIKEILDKWKCYIELTKKFTNNDMELLRVEDIEKVLDCIINLQERNEKAIEYIKIRKEEGCLDKLNYYDLNYLLNILQGSDKDE